MKSLIIDVHSKWRFLDCAFSLKMPRGEGIRTSSSTRIYEY